MMYDTMTRYGVPRGYASMEHFSVYYLSQGFLTNVSRIYFITKEIITMSFWQYNIIIAIIIRHQTSFIFAVDCIQLCLRSRLAHKLYGKWVDLDQLDRWIYSNAAHNLNMNCL